MDEKKRVTHEDFLKAEESVLDDLAHSLRHCISNREEIEKAFKTMEIVVMTITKLDGYLFGELDEEDMKGIDEAGNYGLDFGESKYHDPNDSMEPPRLYVVDDDEK